MTDNNMTQAFIPVPDNTPHRHDEPKLTLNTDNINFLLNGGAIRLYVDDEYMLLLKMEIVKRKDTLNEPIQ